MLGVSHNFPGDAVPVFSLSVEQNKSLISLAGQKKKKKEKKYGGGKLETKNAEPSSEPA